MQPASLEGVRRLQGVGGFVALGDLNQNANLPVRGDERLEADDVRSKSRTSKKQPHSQPSQP
eukprot:3045075-Rhodomonas_salina.1